MLEKSQLKYNYLLQPDDVRAVNETLPQLTVNGTVFRGAGCSNDVVIQRAWWHQRHHAAFLTTAHSNPFNNNNNNNDDDDDDDDTNNNN